MRGVVNVNGVAAVIVPAPKAILKKRYFFELDEETDELTQIETGLSEAEAVAEIVADVDAAAVVVPDASIPTDRKWRGAWFFDGGEIRGNAENARAIALERLRVLRDAELLVQDVEFGRAVGKKDQAAQDSAEVRREALRGATEPLLSWVPSGAVLDLGVLDSELLPLEVLPV